MVHSALPYAAAYLIPFTVLMGFIAGGPFTWATTLVVFGLIPLLDILDGENTDNLSAIDEAKFKDSLPFKLVTWGVAPVQVALVTFGAWVVATGRLSGFSLAGFVLGVGFATGALGITVAHELVHQTNRFEKFLGNVILCAVSYTHWGVEHVYGHHRHVSTPNDPASSRLNESFYAFWPRTVFGTIRSSWNIEVARLARMKEPVLSPHNRILQGWAMTWRWPRHSRSRSARSRWASSFCKASSPSRCSKSSTTLSTTGWSGASWKARATSTRP